MNVTYENWIAPNYNIETFDNKIVICSTEPYNKNWEKKNFILSYDKNNKKPIFLELAEADNPEKALKFCQKYGALVNPYLFQPTSSIIHNPSILKMQFDEYNSEKSLDYIKLYQKNVSNNIYTYYYDYIIYDHFHFYQLTMLNLIELYHLLKSNKQDSQTLLQLFNKCISLISNPYFKYRIILEYSDPFDNQLISELYKPYPLCLPCISMENNSGNVHKSIEDALQLQPSIIENPNISFLQRAVLESLRHESSEKTFYLPHDFLIHNKKEILSLAEATYNDFLSFELHDSHLRAFYQNSPENSSWYTPSLATAIFLFFNLFCNGSFDIKRCANPKCKNLFFCPISRTNKIYCTPECAHRAVNNRYKHKHK